MLPAYKKKSWYTKESNVELVLRPSEYRPISSTGFKLAVPGDCLTVNIMADFFPLISSLPLAFRSIRVHQCWVSL